MGRFWRPSVGRRDGVFWRYRRCWYAGLRCWACGGAKTGHRLLTCGFACCIGGAPGGIAGFVTLRMLYPRKSGRPPLTARLTVLIEQMVRQNPG